MAMPFWDRVKTLLGVSRPAPTDADTKKPTTSKPATSKKKAARSDRATSQSKHGPEAKRLQASSVMALSSSLKALEPGQKGWISFDDAARLFSPTVEHPSEWDEDRLRALSEFAAQLEHRSAPERDAVQHRIYFTRAA
jgi:hypothetical protein